VLSPCFARFAQRSGRRSSMHARCAPLTSHTHTHARTHTHTHKHTHTHAHTHIYTHTRRPLGILPLEDICLDIQAEIDAMMERQDIVTGACDVRRQSAVAGKSDAPCTQRCLTAPSRRTCRCLSVSMFSNMRDAHRVCRPAGGWRCGLRPTQHVRRVRAASAASGGSGGSSSDGSSWRGDCQRQPWRQQWQQHAAGSNALMAWRGWLD
jgi:hypothetical protein